MLMAYQQAGISIPRTTYDQFGDRGVVHVAPGQVKPGDLVFFAGSDGTPTDPGHVGMVLRPTGATTGVMIEAYATGYKIRESSYGTSASAPGDGVVVGFTDPTAHAGRSPAQGSNG